MKKLIIFLLLFFVSCAESESAEDIVVSTSTTTTINQFQTLSEYGYVLQELNGTYCISLPSYQVEPLQCFEDELEALKDWNFRIDLEEYRQGWIVKLLSYPLLTDEEYKITTDYYESIVQGSIVNLKIEGKDYSCEDKDSGTVIDSFANEIHPLNLYEEGEEAASNLGYLVSLDYNCSQLIDGSGFSLYGPLFYQDNQWWGFQESNDDYWRNYGKDIEILAFMTRFAERISLASTNTFTPDSFLASGIPQLEIMDISSNIPEYNRDDYIHWTDYNKDCQDTRQEVLIQESLEPVVYKSEEACSVASGKWYGAYTGKYYYNPSDLDIDHLIPLKNAHISGAYKFDKNQKEEFANRLLEPDHLIAVSSNANRSKGARGPDEWKPENTDYWCEYAYDWIFIKWNWFLTVTTPEWNALLEMIETCPEGYLYKDAEEEYLSEQAKPEIVDTTSTTTSTSTTTTTIAKTTTTTTAGVTQPENPGDTKNCGDFETYDEAKAWFDTYYEYYGDVARLDRDGDLEPCESLPGGP